MRKQLLFTLITFLICVLLSAGLEVRAGETVDLPLKGKIILLDPGHGGLDHGYCQKDSVCEKDTVMEITEKLAALLEEKGAKVKMTHSKIEYRQFPWQHAGELSLDQRVLKARDNRADIFVSLHCNASSKKHRTGAAVFYQSNFPASKTLGDQIQRALIRIPENSKRTDKPGSYYLLNKITIPAVVVETCYLTHRADKENIVSHEYRQKVASAVFSGITNFFARQDYTAKNVVMVYKESLNAIKGDSEGVAILSFLNTVGVLPPDLKIGSVDVSDGEAKVDIKAVGSNLSLGGEEEYQ
ncbi:MAG: N-acetylmuramoyl-L-alanine amidase family protein, partial [Desulfocucumaceae bacterium]